MKNEEDNWCSKQSKIELKHIRRDGDTLEMQHPYWAHTFQITAWRSIYLSLLSRRYSTTFALPQENAGSTCGSCSQLCLRQNDHDL